MAPLPHSTESIREKGNGAAMQLPQPQHVDVFPTRIWQARLTMFEERISDWISIVESMRTRSPISPKRSIRGGWTSNDLTAEEQLPFADLLGAVRAYCHHILEGLGLKDPRFKIQCWMNLHEHGDFNFPHTHCGALLSGCFYLRVPAGSGILVLRDPRLGMQYAPSFQPLNDIALVPEVGLLRVFPPWLEHFVEPHAGDEPRIVLSFNVVKA